MSGKGDVVRLLPQICVLNGNERDYTVSFGV